MNFGQALDALLRGSRVRRAGWNGKGMWVAYSPGALELPAEKFWARPNKRFAEQNGGVADVGASLNFKAADDIIEMGWRPTSRDMLANDWEVLPEDDE